MTRIVLADDHPVVREGLRKLLEAQGDFTVAGEADDGLAALDLVDRLKPDVLILDLAMPGLGGAEVIYQAARRAPDTRVIVLSLYDDEGHVLEALRNGARGYVVKSARPKELVIAVREVLSGRRYLSPPLSERAVEAYVERARAATGDAYEALTPREREVLNLAAYGLPAAEIGDKLGISKRTAETHRNNALGKLGLHSQTELVRWAVRRGIVSVDG
jgi:DNA-binding NarL/FixJ family response regulator